MADPIVKKDPSDTDRRVTMVHPAKDGGGNRILVEVPITSRHYEGKAIEKFREKGFLTVAEADARDKALAMEKENAELKAQLAAKENGAAAEKAAAEKGGGKK